MAEHNAPRIRDLGDSSDPQFMRRQPPPSAPTGDPGVYAPPPRMRSTEPVREDPTAIHKSVDALVREVRDLRVKSENDDNMIALLEQQRAEARKELEGLRRKQAVEIENMRVNYEDQISQLRGGAEVATQKAQAVGDILQDVAQRILEAARRMAGQETPVATDQTTFEASAAHPLLRDIGADLDRR